ncbi:MAG: hypothetical protein Kow00122_03090 [Thermoleophilia bacterium]
MRILLPTIRDPGQIGGTTTHLDMLSRGLEELGHVARVMYLGERVPDAVRKGAIVWPAGGLNRLRRGWGMMYAAEVRGRLLAAVTARELERGAWDVLNVQEVYSVPSFRRVADRHGLPLVLTLHGYPLYESLSEGYATGSRLARNYLMLSELRALRMADAVVTVDTRLYNHVLRLAPELADRATALMNFVDTSAFSTDPSDRNALREQRGIPSDRVVLFCPRRLVKKNGVVYPSLALAAMPPEERSQFLLLHAGEGGEREAIEQIVRENGLEDEVRLLGGQDRKAVAELYRLCDIVLVPSVHSANVEEATSLAALEAMASGRPLIAGAVGGLAEMVRDGVNGILVPGGDAEALAAAILRLAEDAELAQRLAVAARDYVVANHSHLKAADDYLEVYARAGARVSPGELVPADVSDLANEELPDLDVVPLPEEAEPEEVPVSRPAANVLGLAVHRVTLEETVGWILDRAEREEWRQTCLVLPAGAENLVRAQTDAATAEALAEADLRYPEGRGVFWAMRMQGVADAERISAGDLAERLLEGAAREGLSVYLLGLPPISDSPVPAASRPEPCSARGWEQEAERIAGRYPGLDVAGVASAEFSPAEEPQVVADIRDAKADLLLAALDTPRREQFLHRWRSALEVPVAVGLGLRKGGLSARAALGEPKLLSLGRELLAGGRTYGPGRGR